MYKLYSKSISKNLYFCAQELFFFLSLSRSLVLFLETTYIFRRENEILCGTLNIMKICGWNRQMQLWNGFVYTKSSINKWSKVFVRRRQTTGKKDTKKNGDFPASLWSCIDALRSIALNLVRKHLEYTWNCWKKLITVAGNINSLFFWWWWWSVDWVFPVLRLFRDFLSISLIFVSFIGTINHHH